LDGGYGLVIFMDVFIIHALAKDESLTIFWASSWRVASIYFGGWLP